MNAQEIAKFTEQFNEIFVKLGYRIVQNYRTIMTTIITLTIMTVTTMTVMAIAMKSFKLFHHRNVI